MPGFRFTGKSASYVEIKNHPDWEVDYIAAPSHMSRYIDISTKINSIYLKYVAPEDIHVYYIDEVFMDVTNYLTSYKLTAHQLTIKIIRDVLGQTGITATVGIGTNLYLCKVAMYIKAKTMPADKYGVRIAELDEMTYHRELWDYTPITKFWRIGKSIAKRLAYQTSSSKEIMEGAVKLYNNIINHPHHVSRKHPKMSMNERASQFAPFAALNGYEESIDKESQRYL